MEPCLLTSRVPNCNVLVARGCLCVPPADAETQTLAQAELSWSMGLIDMVQRRRAEAMQADIVELVGGS